MLKRDVHVLPMLALAMAGCLWGTGFYFGKIALSEMPVATMVLFRFVFACAGLLVSAAEPRHPSRNRKSASRATV